MTAKRAILAYLANFDFEAPKVTQPHQAEPRSPGDELQRGFFSPVFHTDRWPKRWILQAVLDGEAGRDDQEAMGEHPAARAAGDVHPLPSDEHGHDRGFSRAGGQLQGKPYDVGISLLFDAGE